MPQPCAFDRPGRPPRVWTVLLATVVVFVGVAALGFLALVAELTRAVIAPGTGPSSVASRGLPALLALAASIAAWLVLVAAIAARLSPEPARHRLGLVAPASGGASAWAVAIAGGLAVSQAVDLALRLGGAGRGSSLEAMLAVLGQARGPWLALTLLVVAVGAGFAEELFFRGYAQRRLVARFGAGAGVSAAAALFALAHFDPQHSAFAFVFGLYVGAIARWTGSTWSAIAVHAANNAAAVLLVASGLDDASFAAPRWVLVAALALLAAVALACLAWLAARAAPLALDAPPPPRGGCAS